MSGFLDANMTVRYLTKDPVATALRAAAVIDGDEELYLTEGIIAETAHVLRTHYNVSRADIVDSLVDLIRRRNITLYGLDKVLVIQALEFCRPSGRVSIPDALLWAAARSAGIPTIYTFDLRFPSDGVTVLDKLP